MTVPLALDRQSLLALVALADFRCDVQALAEQRGHSSTQQLVDQLNEALTRLDGRLADLALDDTNEASGVSRRPEAPRYPSLQRGQDHAPHTTGRP